MSYVKWQELHLVHLQGRTERQHLICDWRTEPNELTSGKSRTMTHAVLFQVQYFFITCY